MKTARIRVRASGDVSLGLAATARDAVRIEVVADLAFRANTLSDDAQRKLRDKLAGKIQVILIGIAEPGAITSVRVK